MVAVTYGNASTSAPAPVKGAWRRFLDAIERSQMERARRDIARYQHLLPLGHELRSGELVPYSQKELPFGA